VRREVDLHVREIVFPLVGYLLVVAGIEKAFGVGGGLVVVVVGIDHVEVFAVPAGKFGLVGGPIQSAIGIQIGDIVFGADPGLAIVFADPVGPRTDMTARAVIDKFLVAVDPVHGRVGKSGGDPWPL